MKEKGMMVKSSTRVIMLAVAVLLLGLFCSTSLAIDDCLDSSVSIAIAQNLSPFSGGETLVQPYDSDSITSLALALKNSLLSTGSPFSNTAGVGFPNEDLYYLQSCYPYTSFCAAYDGDPMILLIVNHQPFNNYNINIFRILDSNLNFIFNISIFTPTNITYISTQTPWFNISSSSTSGSWTPSYNLFGSNLNSRTYVISTPFQTLSSSPNISSSSSSFSNSTSFSLSNGTARIISDRNSIEPCNSCISRSPCPGLAMYTAAKAPLTLWSQTSTRPQIATIFNTLFIDYLQQWQISSAINSIALGFNNSDAYILTDCSATPAASLVPECEDNNPFFAEVRNERVFGDKSLHAFAVSHSGEVADIEGGRNEGGEFPTRQRAWFIRPDGWTDPFVARNLAVNQTVYLRGYSKSFFNGVAFAVSNPSNPCPGRVS